jgi:hypothetical protein
MTPAIRYLIVVLSVFVSASCSTTTQNDRSICPNRSSSSYYFPEGALHPENTDQDEFVREWYSKQMLAMGEPSISCGNPGEVYRFTWLRTFHHPVALRVEAHGEMATLYAIELDGAGGYEPGKVLRKSERSLSAAEFKELKSIFSDSHYYSLPTTEDRLGFDGSEWILEQSGKEGYHLVVRWTPNTGEAHKIGSFFLTLSGWSFDEVY